MILCFYIKLCIIVSAPCFLIEKRSGLKNIEICGRSSTQLDYIEHSP
jgi:hypothetical protein